MKKIVVYSSDNCPNCTLVKEYLQVNGFDYLEKNVKNKEFRLELMALKYMSVPITLIDEEVVVGFDKEKIDKLIK